ncbi:MAG: hypothetical protein FWC78_04105 [Defluviitaleaceae bacterium]|nr:hypothetical protein [Defluviitaleaceae bacterium]
MNKISEWRLARKLQASGRRGIIVGLAIAALVCLIIAIVIIKMKWIKTHFGCCSMLEDDFVDDDCCEEGCDFDGEGDFE